MAFRPLGSSPVVRWTTLRGQSREDLLLRIPLDAKSILDFGCGEGFLGEAIKKRQKCRVIGIEQFWRLATGVSGLPSGRYFVLRHDIDTDLGEGEGEAIAGEALDVVGGIVTVGDLDDHDHQEVLEMLIEGA